jgi:hypothetical protein
MARREVIVEILTPDEVCWELYGVAKPALLQEVRREGYSVRSRAAVARRFNWRRRSQSVPGPTLEALMVPKFRKYVEGGVDHADSSWSER